jgi:mandelamide amidase
MDATTLTIGEAAAALRRGETTALAYAEALLAQAAKGAGLNAFIHHDPEQVRRDARAADARKAGGATLGPLHGVPLALKDNLDTDDMPTTGGTPGLRGHRPKRNAAIVQKLRDAGAIVFGKANLHELAYGITNNNAAFGAARAWCRAASAPTPAARCGSPRRCAASSASGRRSGAGRRPASCRSRTPATRQGR